MSCTAIGKITLTAFTLGLFASPGAFARIQNPDTSAEITKEDIHVNQDLAPDARTWELIVDPWVDPDNDAVVKLNPDDPLLNAYSERRDFSAYPKREPGRLSA